MTTHREALVVGINRYPDLKDKNGKPQHLKKPAVDAEEIAQLLEKYGNFRVQRLPEVYSPEGKRGVDCDQRPPNLVEVPILEKAIAQLFNPSRQSVPDTALLFFAGHGLRKEQGEVTEGFLATSDVNPDKGKWGVRLQWLSELLQKSPVRQQIIWLDCCHSGELLNILDEANPGNDGKALDRCLIAACREFEVSREQLQGEHGILTAALLQGLEPDRDVDGFITNYKLADFINKEMSAESQRPIFQNSGNAIILTDKMLGRQRQVDANLVGRCPYKALEYFTQEDAVFFYGRTALTDQLIDQVRTENFIAVLGASGSGKSSVLRAGLLYQLKRGQKLSGSDRWTYYDPFTPGEHPLASLKNAIGKEAQEFSQFIQTSPSDLQDLGIRPPNPLSPPSPPTLGGRRGRRGGTGVQSLPELGDLGGENDLCVHGSLSKGDLGGSPDLTTSPTVETERVVLVIDQFEECFTMCQDSQEREEFFKYLLEILEQAQHKLCLVLGMRADFLGKCAEYAQLAQKIDQHVMVKPMSRQEIEEAIRKPAELVDLQVHEALVTKMTEDVVGSPGSLPLLQYTLTELWNQAQTGANRNRLTLECYHQLGGIEETLSQRANTVYQNLPPQQQSIAKRIFLELTQIGEISDTRRRVFLEDLINQQHSWQLLSEVKDRLVAARLITADAISSKDVSNSQKQEQKVLLDIVHEALIRHWKKLHDWLKEYQVALEIERKIEARAKEWERNGKTEDLGLLLQGATLIEAETYLKDYGNLGLLDGIAQEYIQVSQTVRSRLLKEELERQQRELEAAQKLVQESEARRKVTQTRNIGLGIFSVVVFGLAIFAFIQARTAQQQARRSERETLMSQTQTSEAQVLSNRPLDALIQALQAYQQLKKANLEQEADLKQAVAGTLLQAVYGVQEYNSFSGHSNTVRSLAFSPDGQTIASASFDKTIKLWNRQGKLLDTLSGHNDKVMSVAFSPDGKTIASASEDKTIKLWNRQGTLLNTLSGHSDTVMSVAFSPDSQTIASASRDNTIKLWNRQGKLLDTLSGHNDYVISVAFSPDGKTIASASRDNTIKLWNRQGQLLNTLSGHSNTVISVAFSPDSQTIASASRDNSIRLWNRQGQLLNTLFGHRDEIYSVAFSPDSQTIASASRDNSIRLWNRQGQLLNTLSGHSDEVYSVAFSPDGKTMASAGRDNTIKLWNLKSQLLKAFSGHEEQVNSVAFSPDCKTLASASSDKTIKLWNLEGKLLQTLSGHSDAIWDVAFSPDGKTIASASSDNTIKLWNRQGKLLDTLSGHSDEVMSVAFSPDGKTIASASSDNTINLWNRQGKLLDTLSGHSDTVMSVAFSPDGKTIASASNDKTIKLWNRQGKLLDTLSGHSDEVYSVAFSPDSQTITSASKDKTIKLWNRQGKLLDTLSGHKDRVTSVAFSPDSQTITSASKDKTIKLWNRQGKLLKTFSEHSDEVMSVVFSPDGKMIASVGGELDQAVILWNLDLDDLLARSCDWLHDYLNNPNNGMSQDDDSRHICKGIQPSAPLLLDKGKSLVYEGKVKEAIAAYAEAQKLDPTLEISADSWGNSLCWLGSLHGYAKDVMFACEKAVALAPEDGWIRDSRGLARALTGDKKGAIEDFQAFIKWTEKNEKYKENTAQRQRWIDALQAGKNPFTPEERKSLLNQ